MCACMCICNKILTIKYVTGDEIKKVELGETEGRSLKVRTNDYGDPSANRGHDPKNKIGGSGGGRRGRDTP